MNKQRNIIIILVILIILVIVGIVVVSSINQPSSDTITVGNSSFKQDPRSDPTYKTESGSKITLLESDPLRQYMSELSIDRLEANLKTALYEKNNVISSVASIDGKVTGNDQEVTFLIKIDTDDKTYEVKTKVDGTVSSVSVK